jgi:hypothetical protein
VNADANASEKSGNTAESPAESSHDPLESVQATPKTTGSEGAPIRDAHLATTSDSELMHNDSDAEAGRMLQAQAVDPAFELVHLAVSNLRARDKRTTAAAVKTEMQRLSAGGFSESEYGYETFRGFLLEAEKTGWVIVRLPAYGSGRDAEITLPEDEQPPHSSTPLTRSIRPDIWSSFFDYRPDITRVYDKKFHRAAKFPTSPAPLEPRETTELRARFENTPEEFLTIHPVQIDEQLEWMKEFAREVDGPERGQLDESLGKERPLASFTSLVRSHASLLDRWNQFRLDKVTCRVKEWMQENNLAFDLHESAVAGSQTKSRTQNTISRPTNKRTTQSSIKESEINTDRVRAQVRRAIERMPLSELLQLRIPVEYMLES